MPEKPWLAIVLCAFAMLVASVGAWEGYWRAQGAVPGFRDDDALWAIQRRRIDAGEGDATVFVGASRTFFDMQLPVWEKLSGRRPIQLALDGTSPVFAIEDLADDANFTGRLVIGIAPDIYFTGFEYRKSVKDYVLKESPSQRIGKWLSMRLVEPWFAFYDPDFALFTVFRRQPWPDRAGAPNGLRVRKLSVTDADRNNHMWRKLETDSAYRDLARRVWAQDFELPPEDLADARKAQETDVARTVTAIDKLRARGVLVVFVRDPSAGEFLAYEDRYFPRETTWDVLLRATRAPGIHFQEYPELQQGYVLPEWSHMTMESAQRYTAALYAIIDREVSGAPGRW